MRLAILTAASALAACGKQASVPDNVASGRDSATVASPTALGQFDEGRFLGRWTGVEGMFLVVTKSTEAGRYRLEMQWDLDHHGTFVADATSELTGGPGLSFERDGKALMLRRNDGAATGLKYLAGKRDCLTVAAGEGYCRD